MYLRTNFFVIAAMMAFGSFAQLDDLVVELPTVNTESGSIVTVTCNPRIRSC